MTTRGRHIAEIVNGHGLRSGAELGVKDGRTLQTILGKTRCSMIAVDCWKPLSNELESYDGWDFEAFEESVRQIAAQYPGRVAVMKMSTHEAARHVENQTLDFVFIDADHSYEGVKQDIEDWTPKIVPGGFVIGHDWDWPSVRQAAEEAFRDIHTAPDNLWISRSAV